MRKLLVALIVFLMMVSPLFGQESGEAKLQWTQENPVGMGITHWAIYANKNPKDANNYEKIAEVSFDGTPKDVYEWVIPESWREGLVTFTIQSFSNEEESGPAWAVAKNFGKPWAPSGLVVIP